MPPLAIIDAFAHAPFTGNPAAVVRLAAEADGHWMQQVAGEMNLSETAYVWPCASGQADADFELRWYTPAVEVELCGHATLATAHHLWETRQTDPDKPIRFHTRYSGVLTCRRTGDGRIAMRFPADPATTKTPPQGMLDDLGLPAPPVAVAHSRYDWLFELPDAAAVRGAQPRFEALARFDNRGFILTASADDGADHDYVSRFFAPRYRVNEDPVTGSAHCVLAVWWSGQRQRPDLVGYQLSQRGGTVHTTHEPDADHVTLAGHAVTITRGELLA